MSVVARIALGWGRTPLLHANDLGGRVHRFGEQIGTRTFRQKARPSPVKVSKEELRKGPKLELEDAVEHGPTSWSTLVRPTLFAFAFSGCSIATCAIWQYENQRDAALRSKMPDWWGTQTRKKAGDFRESMRQWWAAQSDGEKLFWPIAGLNMLVFAAWRVPGLQSTMIKWFTSNPAGSATCLPMILSTFSHYSLVHLGCNMVCLHSFMGPTVHEMGKEQFLGVYLSAGVFSSLASMMNKVGTRAAGSHSLGASGAIMAVIGMFATVHPDSTLQIILLPMVTFTAATGLKALMTIDTLGLLLKWRMFDHAAHLAGVGFGVAWCYLGNPLLWVGLGGQLVTAWHNAKQGKNK